MPLTKSSYFMTSGAPVNILDYGASPSSADNSAAIQAAINSGSQVIIPAGNFSYATTLNLGYSTQLIGQGVNDSVLTYTGTGNGIQTVIRGFWHWIANFTLFCTNPNNQGTGIKFGIYEQDSTIENVHIRYFGNGGIEIQGGVNNRVAKCKINNCNRNLVAQSVGILIRQTQAPSPGIPAGERATTVTLENNYVNEYKNTPSNAIGIAWVRAYACYDIRNVTENGDIGRYVAADGQDNYVSVVEPYYEALTGPTLVWDDAFGEYYGGNIEINPNTIATWNATPAGLRNIQYINQLSRSDFTYYNQFGSTKFNGPVDFQYRSVLSYTNFGDQNMPYVSTGTEVNAFAPLTTRNYTLPTAVGRKGYIARLLKTNAANSQTIVPNGSETISGLSSYELTQQGEHVTIISDGSNWQVIEAGGFKQPAIADTSGATLGQLETSVNQMKAAMRNFGIIKI